MEKWKDIKGYEGHYQISSLGSVRSIKKNGVYLMKPFTNKRRYLSVELSIDGNTKTFRVHQLVAQEFLGHKIDGMNYVVDHIDNNPQNNRVDNLQIVSQRYNSYKNQDGYSSKYKGVYWHKKNEKWHSRIRVGDKRKHLGYFYSEIDAANAYNDALKALQKVKR